MSSDHTLSTERILFRSRRSRMAMCASIGRGLFFGVVVGLAAGALAGGMWAVVAREFSMPFFFTFFSLVLLFFVWRKVSAWRGTVLKISSQRILLTSYDLILNIGGQERRYQSLLRATMQTVRWDAYQESVYVGGIFSGITNSGTLTIRYGTADAPRSISISSLPYARDLKHYLDKIHSLRSEGMPENGLPAFVRAKKGKRDVAVLTELG